MNTKLLLLVVYCLFIGCQQKGEKERHDLFINCLINKDKEDIDTLYGGLFVFCKISNKEKIGYIRIVRLYPLFTHNNLYLKMGYPKFIKGVIQQEIVLDEKEVEGSFILDDQIISECNKMSFSDFLDRYTKCMRKNEYRVENGLSFSDGMTVLFCLYQHNYYTAFDDYIGGYYSEKIDLILKRSIEHIEIELE